VEQHERRVEIDAYIDQLRDATRSEQLGTSLSHGATHDTTALERFSSFVRREIEHQPHRLEFHDPLIERLGTMGVHIDDATAAHLNHQQLEVVRRDVEGPPTNWVRNTAINLESGSAQYGGLAGAQIVAEAGATAAAAFSVFEAGVESRLGAAVEVLFHGLLHLAKEAIEGIRAPRTHESPQDPGSSTLADRLLREHLGKAQSAQAPSSSTGAEQILRRCLGNR
jgi:hypothetical protein